MAYDPTIDLLIVDDDLYVLAVLEDLFTEEDGINVTALSDSEEAIALLQDKRFDLVITDLMMPKANGLEVTRAVQDSQPNALVIIVTGFASLETTLEAIKLGVYDYITKPFQIDEFRLLVSNAATRIRLERENQDLKMQVEQATQEIERLNADREELLAQQNQLRENLARREPLDLEAGLPRPRSVSGGAGKIGVYEKMAEENRSRVTRRREVQESMQ